MRAQLGQPLVLHLRHRARKEPRGFDNLGGQEAFDEVDIQLIRSDKEDPATNEEAHAALRITVSSQDPSKLGRLFQAKVTELALACIPGNTSRGAAGYNGTPVLAYWPTLIDILERGGRYTCSGAIAGPMVELDLRTFYLRDLTFTGSTVIDLDVMPNLVRYIEAGEIKPALAATYPLDQLREAQAAFIAKAHTGNIVVVP